MTQPQIRIRSAEPPQASPNGGEHYTWVSIKGEGMPDYGVLLLCENGSDWLVCGLVGSNAQGDEIRVFGEMEKWSPGISALRKFRINDDPHAPEIIWRDLDTDEPIAVGDTLEDGLDDPNLWWQRMMGKPFVMEPQLSSEDMDEIAAFMSELEGKPASHVSVTRLLTPDELASHQMEVDRANTSEMVRVTHLNPMTIHDFLNSPHASAAPMALKVELGRIGRIFEGYRYA